MNAFTATHTLTNANGETLHASLDTRTPVTTSFSIVAEGDIESYQMPTTIWDFLASPTAATSA